MGDQESKDPPKTMTHNLFVIYAIQAGLFAALASIFGKLALNESDIMFMCMKVGEYYDKDWVAPCARLSPLVRGACLLLIFATNSLMWLSFTKALSSSPTTAAALAVNSAANFFFTGIAGVILFGEVLSWKWVVGTLFILAGLFCINLSTSNTVSQKSTASTEKKKN